MGVWGCFVAVPGLSPPATSLSSRVQAAVALSKAGEVRDANLAWKALLQSEDAPTLPPAVSCLGWSFMADSLARLGRDGEAIECYRNSQREARELGDEGLVAAAVLGRSHCLSRLQRYPDAAQGFREVAETCFAESAMAPSLRLEATYEGGRGLLRAGQLTEAIRFLRRCVASEAELKVVASETSSEPRVSGSGSSRPKINQCPRGLLGASLAMTDLADGRGVSAEAAGLLRESGEAGHLLFRWIWLVIQARGLAQSHDPDPDADANAASSWSLWGRKQGPGWDRISGRKSGALDSEDAFLWLAAMNSSPLDAPQWLRVDDKISLHRLMRNEAEFWPRGFLLPEEWDQYLAWDQPEERGEASAASPQWVLKEAAGWGGFGNTFFDTAPSLSEIMASRSLPLTASTNDETETTVLCQEYVSPPMLLDGRKFSVRVYLILLGKEDMYLSSHGLVKLAKEPFAPAGGVKPSRSAHTTNSGFIPSSSSSSSISSSTASPSVPSTPEVALNRNLEALRMSLEAQGHNWEEFWARAHRIASTVMTRSYSTDSEDACKSSRGSWYSAPAGEVIPQLHLEPFCIPKIIGLDLVLDAHGCPFLLEVNRFPGLVGRGPIDGAVKHEVLREAWALAHRTAKVDPRDSRLSCVLG